MAVAFVHSCSTHSDAYAVAVDGNAVQVRGADCLETPPVLNFMKRIDFYSLFPPATVR